MRSLADIGSSSIASPTRARASAASSACLLERLAAPLAVAGGVDGDPLALALAAEGGAVAEQLQGVERLAAAADQDAEVVALALDPAEDPLLVLLDLDLGVEVEGVGDLLEHGGHPARRVSGMSNP